MQESANQKIQFVTAKELGKMLSLSPRTIWRLRSAGAVKFPQPVKIGGAVRWKLADVEKHFENKGVAK
jgi:predicted DNA-binding transcriptional regulator AlpA